MRRSSSVSIVVTALCVTTAVLVRISMAQSGPASGDDDGAQITASELVANVAESTAAIRGWDIEYRLERDQAPIEVFEERQPRLLIETRVHEISQRPWYWRSTRTGHGGDAPGEHVVLEAFDGQALWTLSGGAGGVVPARDAATTPSILERAMALRPVGPAPAAKVDQEGLLTLHAVLSDPRLRLIEGRHDVDGHSCHLLELSEPEPHAAQGADQPKLTRRTILAVDPDAGWLVRQMKVDTLVQAAGSPAVSEHPIAVMRVRRAVETDDGPVVPVEVLWTHFGGRTAPGAEPSILRTERLTIDGLTLNPSPDAALFQLSFPEGTGVFDRVRGISYRVGDPPEEIRRLLEAEAVTRGRFADILDRAAPELSAADWLVGEPVRLEELRGRPVILHFWNIWCAPCIAELPRLERQYGGGEGDDDRGRPVFIAVHTGGDQAHVPEIMRVLEEHEVTFPVMLDAPPVLGESWGATSERYLVTQIPTDARIRTDGRLESVGWRTADDGAAPPAERAATQPAATQPTTAPAADAAALLLLDADDEPSPAVVDLDKMAKQPRKGAQR